VTVESPSGILFFLVGNDDLIEDEVMLASAWFFFIVFE